jgi:hypothetical protein
MQKTAIILEMIRNKNCVHEKIKEILGLHFYSLRGKHSTLQTEAKYFFETSITSTGLYGPHIP